MLHTPDVGEDKATHVRESRNSRFVVNGVEGPDESNEGLHQVDVDIRVFRI